MSLYVWNHTLGTRDHSNSFVFVVHQVLFGQISQVNIIINLIQTVIGRELNWSIVQRVFLFNCIAETAEKTSKRVRKKEKETVDILNCVLARLNLIANLMIPNGKFRISHLNCKFFASISWISFEFWGLRIYSSCIHTMCFMLSEWYPPQIRFRRVCCLLRSTALQFTCGCVRRCFSAIRNRICSFCWTRPTPIASSAVIYFMTKRIHCILLTNWWYYKRLREIYWLKSPLIS